MNEDFNKKAAIIRVEYQRLTRAAEQATDIQKRHNLKISAKAQAYRMKLLLSDNGIKASNEDVINYLKK